MPLTTIYIKIIDGTEAYIPCQAESLSSGLFKIIEISGFNLDDDTCIWSYFPNDTVECSLKELSDSKYLVADKLLNSDYPNRMQYQSVYDIITGNFQDNSDINNELAALCNEAFTYGKKYIPMQEWLQKNCKNKRLPQTR